LKFLRKINRETPKGLDLHLIIDNYATHKHPNVKKMVVKAYTVPDALHSDQLLMAEPDLAMVRRTHPKAYP